MWDGLAARLDGEIVVLEPLDPGHEEGLWAAAQDAAIWEASSYAKQADRARFVRRVAD